MRHILPLAREALRLPLLRLPLLQPLRRLALAIRLQLLRELRRLLLRRPPRHLVHVRLRLRHAARHLRLDDGLRECVGQHALRGRGGLQQGWRPG